MKTTVQLHDFRSAFHRMNRADNFSYEGLELLFNHLEELEQDTGEEIELDVIGLCCEYSEESPETIADYYSVDVEGLDEDEVSQVVIDYLIDQGACVGQTSTGSIVYLNH